MLSGTCCLAELYHITSSYTLLQNTVHDDKESCANFTFTAHMHLRKRRLAGARNPPTHSKRRLKI